MGELRVEADRCVVVSQSFIVPLHFQKNQATAVERDRKIRVKPKCFVAIFQGLCEAACERMPPATSIPANGALRLYLDCLAQVGDGAAVVLLVAVGVSAAIVRGGAVGIEADRLIVVRDGAVI